jgi:hypothetical protein
VGHILLFSKHLAFHIQPVVNPDRVSDIFRERVWHILIEELLLYFELESIEEVGYEWFIILSQSAR